METNFYDQIYDLVRLVPHGRVTTYGAIAKALGAAKSSRMVGYAMNGSHNLVRTVPAHRVVNHKGLLTGKFHFNPPELMQQLLEEEGVKVTNDQVVNFKTHFWDPQQEV